MIDLQQLECFCAVVNNGSFSRAAAVLSIGQPGLSRQVRRLEEQVGAQLLYRNGRGVSLTPSGRRFHETVSDIIAKLRVAYDVACEQGAAPIGTVTLGLPASMSGIVGAPLLRTLRARWPGIKLHLIDGFSGHVHEWLLSGRVDLAILHDARHTPAISVEHLLSEDLVLVGRDPPRGARLEGGHPVIAMGDVAGLPLIVPGPDHGLRRQLDRISAEAGIGLDIDADVDSLTAIKELVRTGTGYSILPIGCVYREVGDGVLRVWRIVRPSVVNTMVLAAAQNRPFTSAMREVRDGLRVAIAAIAVERMDWHATEPAMRHIP